MQTTIGVEMYRLGPHDEVGPHDGRMVLSWTGNA